MEYLRPGSNLKTHQNRWGDTNLKERDPLLHEKTPCGKVVKSDTNNGFEELDEEHWEEH